MNRQQMETEVALAQMKLLELHYRNKGLNAMVGLCSELLGRPLLIHDSSFRVLASSGDFSGTITTQLEARGETYLMQPVVEFIKDHQIMNALRSGESQKYIEKQRAGYGTLVTMIRVNGIEAAQLAIHENGKNFTEYDRLLARHCTVLLSLELQRSAYTAVSPILKDVIPTFIFADALDGKAIDKDAFQRGIQGYAWAGADHYRWMILAPKVMKNLDTLIPSVLKVLWQWIPISQCMVYKSNLLVLLTAPLFDKLTKDAKYEFENFLKDNALTAGVSMPAVNFSQAQHPYKQADKALKMARNQNKPLLVFEDCALHIISDLIRDHYELTDLCHPAVLYLLEQEDASERILLNTLTLYLVHLHEPNRAAERLSIHRNTLFYRMTKIKDATGLRLHSAEEISRVYLSIKFLEMNKIVEFPFELKDI